MGEAAGRRLGVFGGTFDPVHVGHLVAAVNARHALGLDRVLLVVANQPWQKHARAVTPAPDRFAVVEAAVTNMEGLEASAVEVERGGPSYTADTLEELSRRYPDAELFLVIGADVADELDSWERMEAVRMEGGQRRDPCARHLQHRSAGPGGQWAPPGFSRAGAGGPSHPPARSVRWR